MGWIAEKLWYSIKQVFMWEQLHYRQISSFAFMGPESWILDHGRELSGHQINSPEFCLPKFANQILPVRAIALERKREENCDHRPDSLQFL